jgi:dTMP kinase
MMAAPSQLDVRTPAKGRFITFEGGEGAGKSTQVKRLRARLAELGIETIVTREPGGSPEAERLRGLLLSGVIASLGAEAEAIVFSAARIDHLDKTIRPALEEGCFVICDRFIDSTRAYQGATGKVDKDLIADLEKVAAGDTMPDLTVILDVPVDIGLERARGRGEGADRFEQEQASFHETVRQSFLATAAAEPDRCIVVDATQPPDKIENQIWRAVENRFLADSSPNSRKSGRRGLRVVGSGERKGGTGKQRRADREKDKA